MISEWEKLKARKQCVIAGMLMMMVMVTMMAKTVRLGEIESSLKCDNLGCCKS